MSYATATNSQVYRICKHSCTYISFQSHMTLAVGSSTVSFELAFSILDLDINTKYFYNTYSNTNLKCVINHWQTILYKTDKGGQYVKLSFHNLSKQNWRQFSLVISTDDKESDRWTFF